MFPTAERVFGASTTVTDSVCANNNRHERRVFFDEINYRFNRPRIVRRPWLSSAFIFINYSTGRAGVGRENR